MSNPDAVTVGPAGDIFTVGGYRAFAVDDASGESTEPLTTFTVNMVDKSIGNYQDFTRPGGEAFAVGPNYYILYEP